MNEVAIIDFGTNTCNLIITNIKQDFYNEIFKRSIYVGLFLGTDNLYEISDDAILKLKNTCLCFQSILDSYNIKKCYAFCTSAYRDSLNKDILYDTITSNMRIYPKIISGDEECFFVYNSIDHQNNILFDGCFCIVELGGGSSEFVMCDNNASIVHCQCLPIGSQILTKKYKEYCGFNINNIEDNISGYFNKYLCDIVINLKKYHCSLLTLSSGIMLKVQQINKKKFFVNHDLNYITLEDIVNVMNHIKTKIEGYSVENFNVQIFITLNMFYFLMTKSNIDKILLSKCSFKRGIFNMIKSNYITYFVSDRNINVNPKLQ